MIPLTPSGAAFLVVTLVLLLAVPRRFAILPLLVGTCYMTLAQGLQVGPLNFFGIRILIAAGFARALLRGEGLSSGLNGIDKTMLAWAGWALLSSIFYNDFGDALVSNMGLVFNTCGTYFLVRIFCTSMGDVVLVFRAVCVLLVPVAVEMLAEQVISFNSFSVLGGVTPEPMVREGRLRAQGPFAHPILAGTVGAVCLPFAIALWRTSRATAVAGALACLSIIVSSASSGPAMSAIFALLGLALWPVRHKVYLIRRTFLAVYLLLALTMSAPVYYLLARIDLAGGSTGWHRARLIESAIEHLDEWWLAGTNYTRHWMETGVSWSWDHTDITNHYIQLGVVGGLPLMTLFIVVLWLAFRRVGKFIDEKPSKEEHQGFVVWTLGASLFAHATTSVSVSYFDQSFVFLYMTVACIASLSLNATREEAEVFDGALCSTSK
jgi:hypothetical protein